MCCLIEANLLLSCCFTWKYGPISSCWSIRTQKNETDLSDLLYLLDLLCGTQQNYFLSSVTSEKNVPLCEYGHQCRSSSDILIPILTIPIRVRLEFYRDKFYLEMSGLWASPLSFQERIPISFDFHLESSVHLSCGILCCDCGEWRLRHPTKV